MKIDKKQVESYSIRGNGFSWANIYIDESKNGGRISIASDFGDFSHYFPSCGSAFKPFLCGLEKEYLADKFRQDRYFDRPKTIEGYKRDVIEARRQGFDYTHARKIFDEILELDNNHYGESNFVCVLGAKHALLRFYDNCPDLSYKITPQFDSFWNEIWLPFTEYLKTSDKPESEPPYMQAQIHKSAPKTSLGKIKF